LIIALEDGLFEPGSSGVLQLKAVAPNQKG